MLEQQDYNKIREIFIQEGKETEKNVVNQVGDVIENNILPVIDEVLGKVDDVDSKIGRLPDKAYLDDKIADVEGTVVVRQKKEDKKINLLIEILREKEILLDRDAEMLYEIQVFPWSPRMSEVI